MQTPNFRFISSGNFGKKIDMNGTEISGNSPPSNALMEPLIGLKLGKRTYFKNNGNGGNTSSSNTPKKTKSSGQNTSSRFHGLSEFDEKKHNCRRRLSDSPV